MIQLDFRSPIKKFDSDSWCPQEADSTQNPLTPQPCFWTFYKSYTVLGVFRIFHQTQISKKRFFHFNKFCSDFQHFYSIFLLLNAWFLASDTNPEKQPKFNVRSNALYDNVPSKNIHRCLKMIGYLSLFENCIQQTTVIHLIPADAKRYGH